MGHFSATPFLPVLISCPEQEGEPQEFSFRGDKCVGICPGGSCLTWMHRFELRGCFMEDLWAILRERTPGNSAMSDETGTECKRLCVLVSCFSFPQFPPRSHFLFTLNVSFLVSPYLAVYACLSSLALLPQPCVPCRVPEHVTPAGPAWLENPAPGPCWPACPHAQRRAAASGQILTSRDPRVLFGVRELRWVGRCGVQPCAPGAWVSWRGRLLGLPLLSNVIPQVLNDWRGLKDHLVLFVQIWPWPWLSAWGEFLRAVGKKDPVAILHFC